MTSFFKRLLNPGGRPAAESGPARLTLAAFGKHPGWNDHIPGIGVETEALAHVKHALYVSGIGGRIDSGAWKALEPEKRLIGFQHVFLWLRDGHVILGSLHSSEDGLHRREYPLVFCVDAERLAPASLLQRAMPELDRLRNACQATSSTEQVAVECRMAQDRLRDLLLRDTTSGPPALSLSPGDRRRFIEHPDLGPDRVGLLRVLHELGSSGNRGGDSPLDTRPHHLRLPLAGVSRDHALLLWSEFLLGALPATSPLLLIARDGTDWIDVIVGEPTSDDFFCLQATSKALPMASQIPYDLAPALKSRLPPLEAKFLGAELAAALSLAGSSPPPVTSAPPAPPARQNRKWLMVLVGVVGLAAVLAGVWFSSGNRGSPAGSQSLTAASPVPAGVEAKAPSTSRDLPKTNDLAADPAQPKVHSEEKVRAETEAKKLAELKRIAEDNARLNAPGAEVANVAPKPGVTRVADGKAQVQAAEEDAGLAQIALAQGNYTRVLEISHKWSGDDRFKAILAQTVTETNQLFQLNKYLQLGNYAPILARTNPLPDNAKFTEVLAKADAESKLLEQARIGFAQGDYAFLQRQPLQELKTKPPFQKLFHDGAAEAELLRKAQTFKAENQSQAAHDLIVQSKLDKPPFAEVDKWARDELERKGAQTRDQQKAEALFSQGDYGGAAELCMKYSGVAAFEAVNRGVSAEQEVLAAWKKRLAAADYAFLSELGTRAYRAKPPFVELQLQGTAERTALEQLEKLRQANDWQAVQAGLAKLAADVSSKKPFMELSQWAKARAGTVEERKAQSPDWLDAELEILLVRFNVVGPNDRWLQTPEARKTESLDGMLDLGTKANLLNRVKWLRAEYTQRGWLTQRDRKKYLDRLESSIESR